MQKKKLFSFYKDEKKRNKVFLFTLYTFIVVSLLRIFLCYSFFSISNKLNLCITFGMAVLGVGLLFFVVPEIIKDTTITILWLLLVMFFAISYMSHFSGLEYISNTITFLSILSILPYMLLKDKAIKVISFVFLLYACLLVFFANKYGKTQNALINLNTNDSSFVCFLAEIILLAIGSSYKKWTFRLPFYIMTTVFLFAQFQFGGRSTLIASILFLGYFLFRNFFRKIPPKVVISLVIGLFVLGIIFAFFFSKILYDSLGKESVVILGKNIFSGRQRIWSDAFDQMNGHWLLGLGNNLETYYMQGSLGFAKGSNLHNQPMGYLVCFGSIVFVIYTLLLAWLTAKIGIGKKMTVAFILCLIINTYFDTSLFSTSRIVYLPIALLILYYFDKKQKKIDTRAI